MKNVLVLSLLASLWTAWGMRCDLEFTTARKGQVRVYLCEMPILAVTSEQIPLPYYLFSLEKGGVIRGNVTITSAGPLDPLLKVPNPLLKNLPELAMHKPGPSPRKRFGLIVRNRTLNKIYTDHFSWVHLYRAMHSPPPAKIKIPDTVEKAEEVVVLPDENPKIPIAGEGDNDNSVPELDNVYLVLATQVQWEMYLTMNPDFDRQPSKNTRGYVHYSQMIATRRIPLRVIGHEYKFEFEAPATDRFVLLVFNADERELTFSGQVEFINPNGNHLPVEWYYHHDILKFWSVVFAATAVVMVLYLYWAHKSNLKVTNYLLSCNLLWATIFLVLDRRIISQIQTTGTYSRPMWAMAHVLKRFHEIYNLGLMVLLALGYKMLRQELSSLEYQLVGSVCGATMLMGFVEVMVNGNDVSRYLIHTLAFLSIMVAINFNTVVIHSHIADESLTPQAGIAYSHLRSYGRFRILFFLYIFKPAIFSSIRFLCLQCSYDQVIIWDEHLALFLDLAFEYVLHTCNFVTFLPYSKWGLFAHLHQD